MVKELLSNCEAAINGKPCGFCGKMRTVSLVARGTELRPVLSYRISDDACQEFQYAVQQFVKHKFSEYGYPVIVT